MKLLNAVTQIQNLYRVPNDSEKSEPGKPEDEIKDVFAIAHKNFHQALDTEQDATVIESCLLADPNWELSVEAREALLRKGKALGLSSQAFLLDYYSYLGAHLDPGEEKTKAKKWVDDFLGKQPR